MSLLDAETSKNYEARIFPLTRRLKEIFAEQEQATREEERRLSMRIAWLFHDADGEPLARYYEKRGYWKPTRYFLDAWNAACVKGGLVGKIRHDFRSTATRNFDKYPDHIGMALTGHKSHRIYLAYKATTNDDVRQAVAEMEKLTAPVQSGYKVR